MDFRREGGKLIIEDGQSSVTMRWVMLVFVGGIMLLGSGGTWQNKTDPVIWFGFMAVFCIAVLFSYARRTQIDPSLHIITIDQTNLLKHSKRITIPFSNVESISLAYTGGKNRRRTIGFKLKSGKTEHATSYGISGISGEDLLQEVHRTMPDVPVIKPQGFWN